MGVPYPLSQGNVIITGNSTQCNSGENVADLTAEVGKVLWKLFLRKLEKHSKEPTESLQTTESSRTKETQTLNLGAGKMPPNYTVEEQPKPRNLLPGKQAQEVDAHYSVGPSKKHHKRQAQGKERVQIWTTEPAPNKLPD